MHRALLLCEWFILFILTPIILWLEVIPIRPLWLMPIPLIYCLAVFFLTKMQHNEAAPQGAYKKTLLQAIPIMVVLVITAYLISPVNFFIIPRKMPLLWAFILILYPIISALPQEFIYRQFYFERYNELFKGHNRIIWSSAITFSWLHIFYHNWVAILFSFLGGVIFAHSYQRTRSLKLVWLQHSIYGLWIFTVGLGHFFFHQ